MSLLTNSSILFYEIKYISHIFHKNKIATLIHHFILLKGKK